MAASSVSARVCRTQDCTKEAKLQCPTCVKLSIEGSFFCSQECFKGSWSEHKKVHKKAKDETKSVSDVTKFNPWPGFIFTGNLRPAPVTSKRIVPDHIKRPDYADHVEGVPVSERQVRGSTNIKMLSDEEQEGMRVACKLGREVLDIAAYAVDVGVTTEEIDRLVHEASVDRDCYPSPLNYYEFPKSCCTSVNEVICHGIPDLRPLETGDIVNVDVTVYHRGFHGDLNETFFVGEVDEESKNLVKTTHECITMAINEDVDTVRVKISSSITAINKTRTRYREIGNVIQKHAQGNGFSVVRTYCGHGIHQLFHTAPSVPHYAKNKAIGVMKPGHCFTIEPMISQGIWRDETWPDNWTAVTQDGKRSAQFEHTLLVNDTGCEILTLRRENDGRPHFMDKL